MQKHRGEEVEEEEEEGNAVVMLNSAKVYVSISGQLLSKSKT